MKYFDTNGTVFNKELYLENGKFVDPNFKYDDESTLYGFNKKIEKYKETNNKIYNDYKEKLTKLKNDIKSKGKIKWMRILDPESEVNKNFSEGKDNVDKALQGVLGEYYLITYLNTLKKNNADIIFSLIKDFQVKIGYLEIIFYFKENEKIERKIVYVDDYLPFIEGSKLSNSSRAYTPLFTHSKNNRILENKIFLLIEKAYAKINQSYYYISNGNNSFSILYDHGFALTGIESSKNIYIFEKDKNKSYNKISEYKDKNIIFSVYSKNPSKNKENNINSHGIYYSHLYCLKGIEEEREENENLKEKREILFHLWNPHGKNPKNPIYQLKKRIDGTAILNFQDFFDSFIAIYYININKANEIYQKFKCDSIFDENNEFINDYFNDFVYNLALILCYKNEDFFNFDYLFSKIPNIQENKENGNQNCDQQLNFEKKVKNYIICKEEEIFFIRNENYIICDFFIKEDQE